MVAHTCNPSCKESREQKASLGKMLTRPPSQQKTGRGSTPVIPATLEA
jgi:hypothetical protein